MSEDKNLVKIRKLTKKYNGTRALNNINLNLEKGKIIGLLGPNGSGKSTLLKAISGLIKPTSGEILVNNKFVSKKTKKIVSYLPELDYLYPWMTVGETLNFVSSFYNDWNKEREEELLNFMGLNRNKKVKHLSKGMRARLKIIIAVARDVSLVLLDEPLSGIDPPSRIRILQSIISEYKAGEQIIMFSTHEVNDAESVFEDVIFLNSGEIEFYDSAENLRDKYNSSLQNLWEEVYS